MRAVMTVLAIWFAGLGAAAQFGKMSVIYTELGLAYGDNSPVGLAFMVSVIGLIGLIFGTTAGLLVARIGPRRAMLWALALGASISLVQSSLLPFGWMLFSRIPEGLSHLAIVVVGPTAIASAASRAYQGLVMSLWGSFFGLTFTILALFAPALVAEFGIGRLFQLHAGWMLICLALLWWLMPAEPAKTVPPPLRLLSEHRRIYLSPRISAPAMGFVCYTVTYVALLTLLPDAVSPDWAGVTAVAMPLVSIVVSMTLGAWLLARHPAMRVVQFGFTVALLATVGLWLTWGQGPWEAIFAALIGGAMGIVQGASFACIPQMNDSPAERAAAAGAIAQLGNLGTTTGTPLLALLLRQAGVSGLAMFVIGFSVLGIALHQCQARRRISG